MSRSEMAHRSPLLPNASQVMTTDIANGIVESKNINVLAALANGLGWALLVADGKWHFLSVVQLWYSWTVLHWHLQLPPPICGVADRVRF